MKIYKKWLRNLVLTSVIIFAPILIGVMGFNYYVDPLWNFNHSNKLNQFQVPFDERQLKTNALTVSKEDYDSLLIGTSRTTYINQSDFIGLNTFNYSVSSMRINEYNDYIEYAKKRMGKDIKVIIMEVFPKHLEFPQAFDLPEEYIMIAEDPLYRIKSLFSKDTFDKAKTNFDLSKTLTVSGYRSYNRESIAIAKEISSQERTENIARDIQTTEVTDAYEIEDYKAYLKEIKSNNPNTLFILFSPPYLDVKFKNDFASEEDFAEYERWLRECVEVFGDVYNFMYTNSITSNEENYYDSQHFYPPIGTLIANKVMQNDEAVIPEDFGVHITSENIDEHLTFVREQLNHK